MKRRSLLIEYFAGKFYRENSSMTISSPLQVFLFYFDFKKNSKGFPYTPEISKIFSYVLRIFIKMTIKCPLYKKDFQVIYSPEKNLKSSVLREDVSKDLSVVEILKWIFIWKIFSPREVP